MENNDHIRSQTVNVEVITEESCSHDEPEVQKNEQEENEQIIRFEEDLAAYYLDKMAIIF